MSKVHAMMFLLVVFLLVTGCVWGKSACAVEHPVRSAWPLDPIDVELSKYLGRFRQVLVEIEGVQYPFLFDTGGGVTVVGTKVAEAIGCKPFGRMTAMRVFGERIDMTQCGEARLEMGGFSAETEVVYLDIMSLLGEGLPPIEGLISLQTFKGMANNRLIVESEGSLRERTAQMAELSLAVEEGVAEEIFDAYIEVEGRDESLWFLLDSGNAGNFFVAPHALVQLEHPGGGPSIQGRSELAEVEIPFKGLGPTKVSVASPGELVHDGVINAQFMERFVFTIDTEAKRLWASPGRGDATSSSAPKDPK